MQRPEGAFSLDRRQFLKVLGGGIIICFAPVFPDQVREALSAAAAGVAGGLQRLLEDR